MPGVCSQFGLHRKFLASLGYRVISSLKKKPKKKIKLEHIQSKSNIIKGLNKWQCLGKNNISVNAR